MHVTLQFPDSDQGSPIELHWHQGAPQILATHGLSAKGNNTLFLGDQGMLLCGFDRRQLLPENQFADFTPPTPFVSDSPGFHNEWITACKRGQPATCNFDYAGPFAEAVLLGNVAFRGGGFDWDWQTLRTGNNQDAQAKIRESYRTGWEVSI